MKTALYDDDDRTHDMTLFYDARLTLHWRRLIPMAFCMLYVPGGDSSRVAFCTCLHCCLGRSSNLSEYLLDGVRCKRLLCAFEDMKPLYGGMIMIMHLECTHYCTNLSRTQSYQKPESEFTTRFVRQSGSRINEKVLPDMA